MHYRQLNHVIKDMPLVLCAISPIACLSIMAFTGLQLNMLFWALVVPSIGFILYRATLNSTVGNSIVKGWIFGFLAVFVYDLSRIPFMMAGWGDFIPKIGQWLLDDPSAPDWVGYMWRYAGNGGGLGIVFMLLRPSIRMNVVKASTFFGVAVFACLMLTLLLSPNGQEQMFKINPLTFTGSLIGHVVFGLSLGAFMQWAENKKRSEKSTPFLEVSSGFEPL